VPGIDAQTDEKVGVSVFQLTVVVEVEVPRPIPVLIGAACHGDTVAAQAWKSHAQRDALIAVDQQIVRGGAGDRANGQPHTSETSRNAAFGKIVFV